MLKRKINAVLSLLATVLILDHAIFLSVWMLSNGAISKSANYMPWIMTGVVLAHALISIDLGVTAHMENKNRKGKSYGNLNRATIIQRMSGVLMMIFIALHIAGATGVMTPPKVVHAIVPALFYTIVLAHVTISTGKAFITLGIGNAKFVKVVDIVMKVICAATLIASLVSFYLYRL